MFVQKEVDNAFGPCVLFMRMEGAIFAVYGGNTHYFRHRWARIRYVGWQKPLKKRCSALMNLVECRIERQTLVVYGPNDRSTLLMTRRSAVLVNAQGELIAYDSRQVLIDNLPRLDHWLNRVVLGNDLPSCQRQEEDWLEHRLAG